MTNDKVFQMKFSKAYPLLLQKLERKGRSKEELDEVIFWLTGYNEEGLRTILKNEVSYEGFFLEAPEMNPKARMIKGTVCGIRVEEITDPMMQKIRWLDKLVDELAKGKSMEKVLKKDVE